MNNRDARSALLIDSLTRRLNETNGVVRTVAQEQIQRQEELYGFEARLATTEMRIQQECKLHEVTKESLEHERGVVMRLTDCVKHLTIFLSTGTEPTISENSSIEYIPRIRYLEQVIERMQEDLEAKDALIKDHLRKERDDFIAAPA